MGAVGSGLGSFINDFIDKTGSSVTMYGGEGCPEVGAFLVILNGSGKERRRARKRESCRSAASRWRWGGGHGWYSGRLSLKTGMNRMYGGLSRCYLQAEVQRTRSQYQRCQLQAHFNSSAERHASELFKSTQIRSTFKTLLTIPK